MKVFHSVLMMALFALPTAVFAAHEHHGGAAPEAQVQSVPEISPADPGKGGCEKCKKMEGMGGHGMGGMHGKGGMGGGHHGQGGGMGGHQGHGEGGCPKAAALERRIDELEKRLDLMQMLLMKEAR